MRISGAPFIVGMRAILQVFEAFRHEASFKTVFPPIGAVAPVTSVPAGGYAGFGKKVFICKKSASGGNRGAERKISALKTAQKAFLKSRSEISGAAREILRRIRASE